MDTRISFFVSIRAMRFAFILLLSLLLAPACKKAGSSDNLDEQRRQLESLGYMVSEQEPVRVDAGVVVNESGYSGYSYFNPGHATMGVLIGPDGAVVHAWHLARADFSCWRRMYMYPDGDVLVVFEGRQGAIARIDKDSKLKWAVENGAHHDVTVAEDGTIYVLTRQTVKRKELHPTDWVLDDRVTLLTPEGKEIASYSVLDAMLRSPYASQVKVNDEHYGDHPGDVLHTNTLELLDGRHAERHPFLAKGNVLTSFRSMSAIAVFSPEAGEIVWYQTGDWVRQHDPTLTKDGTIVLFNNGGLGRTSSSVMEVDPATGKVVWEWKGEGLDFPLRSKYTGAISVLDDGSILATVSGQGMAVQLTKSKEVSWMYVMPYRTTERKHVPYMKELVRLPGSSPPTWLDKN